MGRGAQGITLQGTLTSILENDVGVQAESVRERP
jgi:hypothetical protein